MRSIEELIKFNDMIVNSGLNPRIQEFLVAINNCNVDPFERLAYAISQQDFEKKYGKFENRIQVRREIADHEFEFLDIKLDGKKITCTLLQTQNGVISNKTPGTEIFIDSDGNGKVSPLDPSKSVKVTTFRLERERIVDVKKQFNPVFGFDGDTQEIMEALLSSRNASLRSLVKDLELYELEQIAKQRDQEIKFFTRDLAPHIVESTLVQPEGSGIYIEKYISDRSGEREIEKYIRIFTHHDGKMEVRFESTNEGVQDYNLKLEEGKLLGDEVFASTTPSKLEKFEDGEGK